MIAPSRFWTHYWQVWAMVTFLAFIGPEIYALATNWQNTLSANIWRFEAFQPGQPIHAWTAQHLLFIGAMLVIVVWLLGHFAFGWWR